MVVFRLFDQREDELVKGRVSTPAKTLEQEIITGALRPGERLDELSLAKRFAVSRTPIREALRHLASIGLVEVRPHRGAIVASPSLKDLLEMFEVMAELEGMCGRLSARRLSESGRKELRRLHEQSRRFVDSDDSDGYYEANVAFHEAIYQGGQNRFLADQTRAIRNRLAPYRRLQLRRRNRLKESFAEHDRILQAIVDGDEQQVDQLLQAHVTIQSGSFTDFIASLSVGLDGRAAG
jgi:DNA-binding GntR family transcriptional regulator